MAVFCGFPLIHHLLDHVDQARRPIEPPPWCSALRPVPPDQ